jgi:naringenin 3-dioxygenase
LSVGGTKSGDKLLFKMTKISKPDMMLELKKHTNMGTITLLFQDQLGGLQDAKDDDQDWITVEPHSRILCFHLGDHMHVSHI